MQLIVSKKTTDAVDVLLRRVSCTASLADDFCPVVLASQCIILEQKIVLDIARVTVMTHDRGFGVG